MRTRIVLLVPLAAGLFLSAAPALSAEPQVAITVVSRAEHGGLTFRVDRVGRSQAASRTQRWRHTAGVLAADIPHAIRVAGDPLQDQQWGLTALRATEVLAAGDARGQVVAVVDSGVDASHPDLDGVVLPGADFVAAGDGRTDPNGHGTHVAGVIAEVGGNGIGGAGLALGVRVLPVRVIGADGSGTDTAAARGLVWATDHGATVANLSFGGPDRSSVMDAAVAYALVKGVAVVAAAGNEGQNGDPILFPAASAGVIAVAAVDRNGVRPAWSSTGSHVALSAPGVGILSTVPGGGYQSWSGTSMAAPFVSAAVALLRHALPGLDPAGVRSRLTSTARDLGPAGEDPGYGYGMVDLYAAEGLTAPVPVAAAPPPTATPLPATLSAAPRTLAAVRITVSRTTVAYRAPVAVSTRSLYSNAVAPRTAVRLQWRTATAWTTIRTGVTGADGLLTWQLRPDRTASYRVLAASLVSSTARIAVLPPRIS